MLQPPIIVLGLKSSTSTLLWRKKSGECRSPGPGRIGCLRPSARGCDFSSRHRAGGRSGGLRQGRTMSRNFSISNRSLESLNSSTRCKSKREGPSEVAQRALTEERLAVATSPQVYLRQLFKIGRTFGSICSVPIWRDAPGRGSSDKPASGRSWDRWGYLPTVCWVRPATVRLRCRDCRFDPPILFARALGRSHTLYRSGQRLTPHTHQSRN